MKKRNLNIFLVIIGIASLLVACFFISRKDEYKEESNTGDIGSFEGVGHYAFGLAGSNNCTHGSSHETALSESRFVVSTPDSVSSPSVSYNWNTVKNRLRNDGITDISNITGGYLVASGKIKTAILSKLASSEGTWSTPYDGRILVIKPNGDYFIINTYTEHSYGTYDITGYLNDVSGGWYFVSFLDAHVMTQTAWGITTVYEDASLPLSYVKLLCDPFRISNEEKKIYFNSNYKFNNT